MKPGKNLQAFDVVIIGAGAAGMMCAAVAGQRGKRVLLIDHAEKLGEKIRISGGGRCNFTNIHTRPENFLSANPHFCRSALARYTPNDFIALLERHGIRYHEKHKGQLFCDESAEQIIAMLRAECDAGQVQWRMPCKVERIEKTDSGFMLVTDAGTVRADKVVIASGGMSIPKIGATDFGLHIAKQFGHKLIEPRPALVPLTFAPDTWQRFSELAGLSLEVDIECDGGEQRGHFREDLLFTHRGLSGPAVLQISSYWHHGSSITINLSPSNDVADQLKTLKANSRQQLNSVLEGLLPRRLSESWLTQKPEWENAANRKLSEAPDRLLNDLGTALNQWRIVPSGTEGYRKAEVMAGGVDTRMLSQQSMESLKQPGLYFIGEVVDVTGWLGGYNFQWAWASGHACGSSIN